jgi:hypothetical protein
MTESDNRTDELVQDQLAQGRDPGPIDEDAMKAADGLQASPEAAQHHQEMDKIGANAKGEGRVP